MLQGHPVGLLGEEGGATTGTLSDGVSGGIESSEHHNPPEMLDGLDGKTYKYHYNQNYILDFTYFLSSFVAMMILLNHSSRIYFGVILYMLYLFFSFFVFCFLLPLLYDNKYN